MEIELLGRLEVEVRDKEEEEMIHYVRGSKGKYGIERESCCGDDVLRQLSRRSWKLASTACA